MATGLRPASATLALLVGLASSGAHGDEPPLPALPPSMPTEPAPSPVADQPPATTPPPAVTPAAAPPAPAAVPTTATHGTDTEKDDLSHALSLDALGVQVSWGGYGDATLDVVPFTEVNFEIRNFNFIPLVRLNDVAWAEMELEVEDVIKVGVEYAQLTWAPAPWLRLTGGKLILPIGRFNRELHPSFRWEQINAPAMMAEAMPTVWGEAGLAVAGTLSGASTAFDYEVYVTNGVALIDAQEAEGLLPHALSLPGVTAPPPSDVAVSGPAPATEAEEGGGELSEAIHGFRALDNNIDKAVGARLTLTILRDSVGETAIGVSGYTAAIDAGQHYRLSLVDADVTSTLGPVVVRAEFAQTFLTSYVLDRGLPLETGGYLQVVYTYGLIQLAARGDVVGTRELFRALTWRFGFVPTVGFLITDYARLRLEVAFPFNQTAELGTPTFTAMASFMF